VCQCELRTYGWLLPLRQKAERATRSLCAASTSDPEKVAQGTQGSGRRFHTIAQTHEACLRVRATKVTGRHAQNDRGGWMSGRGSVPGSSSDDGRTSVTLTRPARHTTSSSALGRRRSSITPDGRHPYRHPTFPFASTAIACRGCRHTYSSLSCCSALVLNISNQIKARGPNEPAALRRRTGLASTPSGSSTKHQQGSNS